MAKRVTQDTGTFSASRAYDRYQRALARLAGLLRGRYWTARQLAKRTKVSRLSVYRQLEALHEKGINVSERRVRERSRGPCARAFTID